MLGQTWLRIFRPNSYIPTFVPVSGKCPGPHPLRLSVRAEIRRGAQSDLDLAAGPGVGMYESRPSTLSQALDTATANQDFRKFVRSYADC
jgi:hypothetical protein